MLKRHAFLGALGLSITIGVGCGSSNGPTTSSTSSGTGGDTTTTATTTTTSGTGGAGGAGGTGGEGGTLTCDPGQGTAFAGTKLYFGEGNSGQWKKVGYNLDGLTSTAGSKDVCQPNAGAFTTTAYPDGDNGIDNSFGKNLLPQIMALYPTWPDDVNNGIQGGFFNILLKVLCLPETGDAKNMVTKLFGGTELGSKPKFDGTDKWPVSPELLSDMNDPESSTVLFQHSSIVGTTFNAGPNGTFIISIPIHTMTDSTSMKLTLYAAHLEMTLSADRKTATGGMIGGVLNTEEFVAEMKKVGYLLQLCDSPIFDGLITQIRQSSDIMSDGTQDPSKICDGISMGLGFEMAAIQIGDVGPANKVGDSCN
ncbi:MAG: hypothetical protein U0359_03700 [Byssovorax sp.]